MTLVVCPGFHDSMLTDRFLESLNLLQMEVGDYLVVPTNLYPPFSGGHILRFLQQHLKSVHLGRQRDRSPLLFIGYSAGVAGAMGAAWAWQQEGGNVQALIALDGWGVPLFGNFPCYRVSHDHFTHWSSAILGHGLESFYADPPVPHLDLWRQPAAVSGWWIRQINRGGTMQRSVANRRSLPTTAADFIKAVLRKHSVV